MDSELLSRGWVYQEILLTPANLFCSDSQMWWSCAHASYSQTSPFQMDNHPKFFEVSIQNIKAYITGRTEPWSVKIWQSVLERYVPTLVTFGDDRLVALRGVAQLFRSLYPDELMNAEYHSGVWSTDIMRQLLWQSGGASTLQIRKQNVERDPTTRISTNYYIPTWSPLRASSLFQGTFDYDYFGQHKLLPNRFISIDTSRLDDLGRASDMSGCELTLEGVLVDITVIPHKICEAYPTVHAGSLKEFIRCRWDNSNEETLAARAPDNCYRTLNIATRISRSRFSLIGILLRPLNEQETFKCPQATPRWVRCGILRTDYYFGDNIRDMEGFMRTINELHNAFQLTREYGVKWEVDNIEKADQRDHWHLRRLHDPTLERICIV